MKKIEAIVFLYNGKQYIESCLEEFDNQKTPNYDKSLRFILTDTNDGSKELLDEKKTCYEVISPKEFNHALTREKAIYSSSADIVILFTQDARMVNDDCLEKLANCIDDDIKYAYLRQVNNNWSIERYTRKFNYPKESLVKDKTMIDKLGINTFFASDTCAAVDKNYFILIGGYDSKPQKTNEDMYYAHKVILGGKKVKYCADTYVEHTHKFTLKQLEKRYELFGAFFKENPEIGSYASNGSGIKLALKIIGNILINFNIPALIMFIPNMLARYIGKKKGSK